MSEYENVNWLLLKDLVQKKLNQEPSVAEMEIELEHLKKSKDEITQKIAELELSWDNNCSVNGPEFATRLGMSLAEERNKLKKINDVLGDSNNPKLYKDVT